MFSGRSSVGLNINLPDLQTYNPYLTENPVLTISCAENDAHIRFRVHLFSWRIRDADEFFEIVTLVQTKIKIPIVLFGKEYWEPLLAFIENKLYREYGAIDEGHEAVHAR